MAASTGILRSPRSSYGRDSTDQIIPMASEGSVPDLLKPDDVPNDVICSICMNVPTQPVLTPCDHMFCKGCLQQAVQIQPCCPVDREACTDVDIVPLRVGSFPHRIWSAVEVKCEAEACPWSGSIADFEDHCRNCEVQKATKSSRLQLRVLEAENQKNRMKVIELRFINKELLDRVADLDTANRTLETALDSEKELRRQENRRQAHRPASGVMVHYNFNRTNVVQLSQFISRYLENKPAEVDANKIFNCIRSCYMDLKKNYEDNPEHYEIDMRMLVATCHASTWFTDKQTNNFWNWLCERNWN
jgi:hypothetical protein